MKRLVLILIGVVLLPSAAHAQPDPFFLEGKCVFPTESEIVLRGKIATYLGMGATRVEWIYRVHRIGQIGWRHPGGYRVTETVTRDRYLTSRFKSDRRDVAGREFRLELLVYFGEGYDRYTVASYSDDTKRCFTVAN
jgi:hypothetical protein